MYTIYACIHVMFGLSIQIFKTTKVSSTKSQHKLQQSVGIAVVTQNTSKFPLLSTIIRRRNSQKDRQKYLCSDMLLKLKLCNSNDPKLVRVWSKLRLQNSKIQCVRKLTIISECEQWVVRTNKIILYPSLRSMIDGIPNWCALARFNRRLCRMIYRKWLKSFAQMTLCQ